MVIGSQLTYQYDYEIMFFHLRPQPKNWDFWLLGDGGVSKFFMKFQKSQTQKFFSDLAIILVALLDVEMC